MAETARQWIERVFKGIIENGNIIMAKAVKKVKQGKKTIEQPTGAKIFVSVDTFETLFKEEIEAGSSDLDIAKAIAAKKVTRPVKTETGEEEREFELGYGDFIASMNEKGLFG